MKTYEAKGEDTQRADGVSQHTVAKQVHVADGDHQVPEEVACGQALDHA